MNAAEHRMAADRIARSLAKCNAEDYEMKIEAAMLAGTHLVNEAFHRMGVTQAGDDIMHTYLLTINQFRRFSVAGASLMDALAAIEDLRAPYVRGNRAGGEAAAERALALLSLVRGVADEHRYEAAAS